MKKLSAIFTSLLFSLSAFSQNVGVNTTTPEASLDVVGDVIFRTVALSADDGITLAMDVNTNKAKSYRVVGPAADFIIGGITAGIDGRVISLFNRSGFNMQLNNEDPNATAADQIVTGTPGDLSIPNKGSITLQYDGDEGKWIVMGSSKGALPGSGGYWDSNGNDIYNNNSGNVGIGTTTPSQKLTILTGFNTTGWQHIGELAGADPIIVSEGIGGVSGSIGTFSEHAFRLSAGVVGRASLYPGGEFVIGPNSTGAVGKLTVQTTNNADGISHLGENGNILKTRMGGTSAGIGTYSPTHMRIFCNSRSDIFIASATGNVGIGTENFDTYKLAVNGSIRAKEIRINTGWADYVFNKNYKLRSLPEVEKFIKAHKRLPDIPAASTLKKEGVDISQMQTKMMAKIEELTLYMIEANKTIESLKQRIFSLEKENN